MSDLDDLLACDRQELIMRWRRAFGTTPPKHTSMQFLQKVLAHDLQCKTHGDVPKRIDKQLKAVLSSTKGLASNTRSSYAQSPCNGVGPGPRTGDNDDPSEILACSADRTTQSMAPAMLPTLLSPGVQLVREWNGRTWQVEVLEDGFACRGKTYRSLSAIARMITGTRWSGPRFFGLRPS